MDHSVPLRDIWLWNRQFLHPPPFLPLPHFGLDARSGPQTNKIRPNILTKGQQRSWRASEEDVGAHHPTPRKSQNCILNSRQEKRPMYISPYFCSLLILYFVFFSWEEIPFSRTDDGPQSREAWWRSRFCQQGLVTADGRLSLASRRLNRKTVDVNDLLLSGVAVFISVQSSRPTRIKWEEPGQCKQSEKETIERC